MFNVRGYNSRAILGIHIRQNISNVLLQVEHAPFGYTQEAPKQKRHI